MRPRLLRRRCSAASTKTGLRVGELLALKWSRVDLKAEGPPKGAMTREVPLGNEVAAALTSHRLTHSMVKTWCRMRASELA
jgi:integrase